jgi:sensor histidine kinase regulating citrate/malate metabolism
MQLVTRWDGAAVVIEVADDGRGIDWNALRDRARAAGRPSVTRDDLIAAMFSDGISTRPDVSETSGRGVGLAALRDACTRLGGSVEVESEPGLGTRFRFKLPLERQERMTSKIPRLGAGSSGPPPAAARPSEPATSRARSSAGSPDPTTRATRT